jgi:hypothetical protein
MSGSLPSLPVAPAQLHFAREAARAAQAAFFQAALGQTQPARPAAAAAPVRSVPTPSPLFPDAPEPMKADRPLRPGALLDIRV